MGKALAIACLVFAACQPMYKDKAETLKNPPKRNQPVVVVGPEPEPTFVDACDVDFSAPPVKSSKRRLSQSQQQTSNGNAALQPVLTARPTTATSVKSASDAVDLYRKALVADPYNAEATLKLALAYDRLLRKGCALALLRRLDSLASNGTLDPHATPMVDLVVQNPHWFKPYHSEALKAVGR